MPSACFHLYAQDVEKTAEYLEEGVQARVPMPAMPHGDQQASIELLLAAEEDIRQGRRPRIAQMHPYWADLARLLQVYRYTIRPSKAHRERIKRIKNQMHSDVYDMYIEKRERRKAAPVPMEQPLFPPGEFDMPSPDA